MPTVQEIFDLATRGKPNLVFPKGRIDSTNHKLMMVFYEYSIRIGDELTTKNINNALFSITLPVPIKILERYDVEYSSVSVTDTLATEIENKLREKNESALTKYGSLKNLGSTALALAGKQLNPFNIIQLKGAKLRRHNFRWKLHPENKNETNDIEKIINSIRVNMHPKGNVYGDILLNYPNLINFRIFGPKDPNHIFPAAPCVIDNFIIDRTGGDYPTFFGETGTPVVYQIQMAVMEILPMLNRDGKLDTPGVLIPPKIDEIDELGKIA